MADTETSFVIHNDNVHQTLIPSLERLLPSSVPLLRRIQYNIARPRATAYYVASANLSQSTGGDEEPWTAAFVDLFAGRETQVWVYSSLEAEADNKTRSTNISTFSYVSSARRAIARKQIWDLLRYINRELMPAYQAYYSKTAKSPLPQQQHKAILPHQPPSMLLGSLHTGLMQLLSINDSYTDAIFRPTLKVHRYDVTPYVKYVFEPSVFQNEAGDANSSSLPPGYRYGDDGLQPQHVELVRSRTHIPREPQTLLSMPSVVVYHATGESPVAWGFLGLDGSLATLHVEPEHRGQGLAVLLSREIMRRGMASGAYGAVGSTGYGHADVALENRASRRVMEKVGGKEWQWSVTWAVVEVVG